MLLWNDVRTYGSTVPSIVHVQETFSRFKLIYAVNVFYYEKRQNFQRETISKDCNDDFLLLN